MTALVAGGLLVLALLDGMFSGFRSSVGRTGLIDHRDVDTVAARRGLVLVVVLLTPVIIVAAIDVVLRPARLVAYDRTGLIMLATYGAFGIVVLLALAVYRVLSWRWKYLATAVILGPCTLARPLVVVVGGALAVVGVGDALVAVEVVWAATAVLSVEPLADRVFYGPRARNSGLMAHSGSISARSHS